MTVAATVSQRFCAVTESPKFFAIASQGRLPLGGRAALLGSWRDSGRFRLKDRPDEIRTRIASRKVQRTTITLASRRMSAAIAHEALGEALW